MRISNIEVLYEKISEEVSWRKKELTSMKLDITKSREQIASEQSLKIRCGILLLYAHFEGVIKKISEYYLNYIGCLNLNHKELKKNFLAISIKYEMKNINQAKKIKVYKDFIKKIEEMNDENFDIRSQKIIDTQSNLKSDIFENILLIVGLNPDDFELALRNIDEKLVGNRNRIAHGERIDNLIGISNIDEYIDLHEDIILLIERFSEAIQSAAIEETYKS